MDSDTTCQTTLLPRVTLTVKFLLTCRCILQLSLLGYVLAPLFHFNTWWLVLLYAGAMLAVSSAETVSRPSASYKVPSHDEKEAFLHLAHILQGSTAIFLCYRGNEKRLRLV